MARGVNKVILISLYQSGMSIPEIAAETGKHASTIRFHLHKAGVLRSRAAGVRNAAQRGRLGSGNRGKTRTFTEQHCKAISEGRLRHAERNAAGMTIKPSGYVEFTRGEHKGKAQHRVVMALHIGRELHSDEHVHHRDGDRKNNIIENLELMSASQHAAHHGKENHLSRRRNANGTWR